MTTEELIEKLKDINERYPNDEEAIHSEMDKVLLEYINDKEVTGLFNLYAKWYS